MKKKALMIASAALLILSYQLRCFDEKKFGEMLEDTKRAKDSGKIHLTHTGTPDNGYYILSLDDSVGAPVNLLEALLMSGTLAGAGFFGYGCLKNDRELAGIGLQTGAVCLGFLIYTKYNRYQENLNAIHLSNEWMDELGRYYRCHALGICAEDQKFQ